MSDNDGNRASSRLDLSPADGAGEAEETGRVDRCRRDFLRRAAMAGLIIPGVGGMARAGDDKKKHHKDASLSAADAKHEGSAKQGSTPAGNKKQSTALGSTTRQSPPSGGPKQSMFRSGTGSSKADTAAKSSSSRGPLTRDPDQINHTSARRGNAGATPATSRVKGGKPLPEIYKKWNLHNFDQIQADENAHVAFLVKALGAYARPMPVFQDLEQSSVHDFAMVARALENTGVGAYLGALPVLASTAAGQTYLGAAGSIALVEARHAGYLNSLLDLSLDENIEGNVASLDLPLTPQQVVSLASPFIANLNGGPPLIPAGGFTNPLDILNFALALEYLEAEFYNINVPNLKRTLSQ